MQLFLYDYLCSSAEVSKGTKTERGKEIILILF
jgi:hypothetical protein